MAMVTDAHVIIKLTAGVIPKSDGNILIISPKPFMLSNISTRVRDFILALRDGIEEKLFETYGEHPIIKDLIVILKKHNLITSFIADPHYLQDVKTMSYLASLSTNYMNLWDKIQQAHVAIVGCGGMGAVVAQELTAMGFSRFTLLDGDVVETSNLNRQTVYTRADVGKRKVEILAERLKALRENICVESINSWIKKDTDLNLINWHKINLIVCAADQPSLLIKSWFAKNFLKHTIPTIFCGTGLIAGSWGPLLSSLEHAFFYTQYLNTKISEIDTNNLRVYDGSLCASNHIVASFAAWDIFHFIIEAFDRVKSLNKACSIAFPAMSIKEEDFIERP